MISTLQVIFLSDALVLRKAFFSNSLETVENKHYHLAEVWIATREERNLRMTCTYTPFRFLKICLFIRVVGRDCVPEFLSVCEGILPSEGHGKKFIPDSSTALLLLVWPVRLFGEGDTDFSKYLTRAASVVLLLCPLKMPDIAVHFSLRAALKHI